MAERRGFEPPIRCYSYNGLANRRLRPLGHRSIPCPYLGECKQTPDIGAFVNMVWLGLPGLLIAVFDRTAVRLGGAYFDGFTG